MNVETATIKTTSDNVNIEQMTITEKANISNANKKVVVDNTNFAPVLDADLQLYLKSAKNLAYHNVNKKENTCQQKTAFYPELKIG